MFMWCNDWIYSDWTLDVVFIAHDGMKVVYMCIVGKGVEKHISTLKWYNNNKCEPFESQ